jgi:hypothetical protein
MGQSEKGIEIDDTSNLIGFQLFLRLKGGLTRATSASLLRESNPQGYGEILNNGPRIFDKPSPKRRRRLIMDGRFVCAVCLVSTCNGDPLQVRAY